MIASTSSMTAVIGEPSTRGAQHSRVHLAGHHGGVEEHGGHHQRREAEGALRGLHEMTEHDAHSTGRDRDERQDDEHAQQMHRTTELRAEDKTEGHGRQCCSEGTRCLGEDTPDDRRTARSRHAGLRQRLSRRPACTATAPAHPMWFCSPLLIPTS